MVLAIAFKFFPLIVEKKRLSLIGKYHLLKKLISSNIEILKKHLVKRQCTVLIFSLE